MFPEVKVAICQPTLPPQELLIAQPEQAQVEEVLSPLALAPVLVEEANQRAQTKHYLLVHVSSAPLVRP